MIGVLDPPPVDDRTVGLVLRALRRRRGWRQSDLAERAGCSQGLISSVERGHLDTVALRTLRSLFRVLDARVLIEPRWRGAELDRLIDSEHARIVDRLAARLEAGGLEPSIEVTYAIGGERGSIDVLGVDPVRRAVLVCEVKTDIAAAEAVGRKLDEKRRLAARIVFERFGWTPAVVGVVLVMPESPRLRRLFAGPAASLARMFPVASRAVRSWLRNPVGPIAATWFLSDITPRNPRRVSGSNVASLRSGGSSAVVEPIGESDDEEPRVRILR